MLDPRDRGILNNLTDAINNLTKSIQPDASFHKRQVPSLKRQSKTLEFIREKREAYVSNPNPIVTNQVVLDLLDQVGDMLIKS